jgi:hypothetical protein
MLLVRLKKDFLNGLWVQIYQPWLNFWDFWHLILFFSGKFCKSENNIICGRTWKGITVVSHPIWLIKIVSQSHLFIAPIFMFDRWGLGKKLSQPYWMLKAFCWRPKFQVWVELFLVKWPNGLYFKTNYSFLVMWKCFWTCSFWHMIQWHP